MLKGLHDIFVAMKQVFTASYSTLGEAALAAFITTNYDMPGAKCKFLVRGVSDTYLVTADSIRYIFRVYRCEQRTLTQVQAEAELLIALNNKNVPVSYPIAATDGSYAQKLQAPEGERYAMLFTYAVGKAINMPGTGQLQHLGRAMAGFHNVSSTIQLSDKRWTFDIETTLTGPLEAIKFAFEQEQESYNLLTQIAGTAREKLVAFDSTNFTMGYCHFDFLPKNFHFDGDKVTLFDFDFFGYGWLVNDIMTFWIHLCWEVLFGRVTENQADNAFAVFIAAYRSIRPVSGTELSAIPYLAPGFWLFYLGFYPTHDQFYPLLQPAALKMRVDFICRMEEKYWNDATAQKLSII